MNNVAFFTTFVSHHLCMLQTRLECECRWNVVSKNWMRVYSSDRHVHIHTHAFVHTIRATCFSYMVEGT